MTEALKPIDLKISRKMGKLIRKTAEMVTKEVGERVGVTLIVHPYGDPKETRQFQYGSNLPREHMHNALRSVLAKWENNSPDTPPHLRGQQ